MSELLASVKRSFFHDVLGVSDAEARLEGREGAYLLRESDVKSGETGEARGSGGALRRQLAPSTGTIPPWLMRTSP